MQDIQQQGLSFPTIAAPQRIIYQFDPATDAVFTETIALLQKFHYARYTPRLYLLVTLSAFEQQAQHNVSGFMKGLLVKRLESSFHAFRQTLSRFQASYDRFIAMVEAGEVYISQSVDVYDLLDRDDAAEIEALLQSGELDRYAAASFDPSFLQHLYEDRQTLTQIQELWQPINQDPKLAQFTHQLQNNPLLSQQKAIIFTESAETADYLYQHLNSVFPTPPSISVAMAAIMMDKNSMLSKRAPLLKPTSTPAIPNRKIPSGSLSPPMFSLKALIFTEPISSSIMIYLGILPVFYNEWGE